MKFPTLFFGQPCSNQGIKMSYQTIVQWKLLHKTMILPHTYQTIKILIHCVISSSWIRIRKAKLLGHQLQAHGIIKKPNLDAILH